jgi:hypothetical protein
MITRDIPTKEHAAAVEDKSRPGLEHGVNLVKVKKVLNHHLRNTWHETEVKKPTLTTEIDQMSISISNYKVHTQFTFVHVE